MRLCRGQRRIAKTSATNGLIAGSLEALSLPGDLSKIGGRDFLRCTNLMELTAQGFTRTVSITLATKMQSQSLKISAIKKLKTCSPGINLNSESRNRNRKSTIKKS
jgi:hypothetical protein